MNAAPDLLRLLRDQQYDALQTHLGGLQEQFEAGALAERDLLDTFDAFKQPDPALGERFGEWMEAHVGSYAAHVALAEWLHSRGRELRGGATSNLVSDHGRRGLLHHVQQAESAARHATTLTHNPLAAWLVIGSARSALGCELEEGDVQKRAYPDWYAEPLAQNSGSLQLRLLMLSHLRAEWGGSETLMLAFVRQQQEDGLLSQADIQRLWGRYHANAAHHAWLFTHDLDKALEHARLAADLNEAHSELLFALLVDMGAAERERRAALERFVAELERHPERGLWHGGNALAQSADLLPSLAPRLGAALTRMAELGHAEAATTLARLKLKKPSLNLPNPTPLLRAAIERGDVHAANALIMLAQNDPHLPERDKLDHMLRAADLGSDWASWIVYEHFEEFRQAFGLEDRARYRYLLRAADAGENDARFALAQQLRAGFVELGDDGVLRPVDTRPIQDSLNYAQHLLERAANEDHKGAQQALKRAKEKDWDAATAPRLKLSKVASERETQRAGWPWWRYWLMGMVVVGLLRACASLADNEPPSPQTAGERYLEQMMNEGARPSGPTSP